MAKLFETASINNLHLRNRFVRSATWEGLAEKGGGVTTKLLSMMAELAKNEVGLIISSYAFVAPEGQSSPYQLAVYGDHFVPGLKTMAQAVHEAGGKIALQIVHGGKFSSPELTGQIPFGPSDEEKDGKTICRSMGKDDILETISAFARAALRAKTAGFDAVQIHAAHGFLLSQFLSPAFNRRNDEYGGSLKNRKRFLLQVMHSVRESVGKDFPILVKLNSEDFLENGMTQSEMFVVAKQLELASADAIELSGGTILSGEFIPTRNTADEGKETEAYYTEAAKLYKRHIAIPLMLVGGIRSFDSAEDLVNKGSVDFISLSRPLISEPGLIKRWHGGDHSKAKSISCNGCFRPALEGNGIRCIITGNEKI